jgi:protein-S-isoprenylcysteine O-methyltransferase Ste14
MRHPLYSGTFFLVAGVLLWHPTVAIALFFAITILYIEIGSRLEERKLTEEFGQAYSTYARNRKTVFSIFILSRELGQLHYHHTKNIGGSFRFIRHI